MACIGLTSDVEGQVAVLGELVEEVLQEGVEILGNLLLVRHVTVLVLNVGEASASGLVDEEQVGELIPSVLVGLEGQVLVDSVRSVLKEHSKFYGTSWCERSDAQSR